MLSEVSDVVRLTDISLNSEFEVIKSAEQKPGARENFTRSYSWPTWEILEKAWDKEEMVEIAEYIENRMINIQLVGIGTNLGCYGSIAPTAEKLEELVELAEKREARLDRELEYISGGATSSLMRVWDKDIPERVNLLRVGEGILLARDLDTFYGYDMSELLSDVFRLKAEVIEVKTKPSYPVGTMALETLSGTSPLMSTEG